MPARDRRFPVSLLRATLKLGVAVLALPAAATAGEVDDTVSVCERRIAAWEKFRQGAAAMEWTDPSWSDRGWTLVAALYEDGEKDPGCWVSSELLTEAAYSILGSSLIMSEPETVADYGRKLDRWVGLTIGRLRSHRDLVRAGKAPPGRPRAPRKKGADDTRLEVPAPLSPATLGEGASLGPLPLQAVPALVFSQRSVTTGEDPCKPRGLPSVRDCSRIDPCDYYLFKYEEEIKRMVWWSSQIKVTKEESDKLKRDLLEDLAGRLLPGIPFQGAAQAAFEGDFAGAAWEAAKELATPLDLLELQGKFAMALIGSRSEQLVTSYFQMAVRDSKYWYQEYLKCRKPMEDCLSFRKQEEKAREDAQTHNTRIANDPRCHPPKEEPGEVVKKKEEGGGGGGGGEGAGSGGGSWKGVLIGGAAVAGGIGLSAAAVRDGDGGRDGSGPGPGPGPTPTPPAAPTAALNITPSGTGMMRLTSYTFDGSASTGDGLTYDVTFGDGSTGTGAMTTHVYAAAGTYSPMLTARNASGSASAGGTVRVERDLNGTWTGRFITRDMVLTINQAGMSLSGPYADQFQTGSLTGTLASANNFVCPCDVMLTIMIQGLNVPLTFAGQLDGTYNQMMGRITAPPSTNEAVVLTRR